MFLFRGRAGLIICVLRCEGWVDFVCKIGKSEYGREWKDW